MQNNVPTPTPKMHILIPRRCEYVMFQGKMGIKVTDGFKVADQLVLR